MGDIMTYTCVACSEQTMGIFNGKEKALFHLFEMDETQQAVFLYSFISYEMIARCLKYYSSDHLEILNNQVFFQDHWLRFNPYSIETDNIMNNVLFDYMKKYHKIWCCRDDKEQVVWLKGCNIIQNCVK